MIYDALAHFATYKNAHPLFTFVHDYIGSHDLTQLPLGKQDIGNGIFLISARYQTKKPAETFIECHRRYIDIQIITSGAEKVGICRSEQCKPSAYNEENDYLELQGSMEFITLQAGFFAIFYPQDGHMPQLNTGAMPAEVSKIVFKIPV
ncbi:YhcH/YjgK/YiaL family protein [Thiovibrio sp. JS02]